jgi:hypothetical protein
MALPALSYSVADLFTQALTEHFASTKFLIAAYQRGYKWKAATHIRKLLRDLLEAYTGQAPDYYLQYITVKQTTGAELEVVDGQQRLTTLSVFFAVSHQSGHLKTDFTDGRLRYAIREIDGDSLLDRFIYHGNIGATLAWSDWKSFALAFPEADRQDMFHLFSAAKEIKRFFEDELDEDQRQEFTAFVAKSAKLIVNNVGLEAAVSSETTFSNLNNNRVDLTDLDLVKGLLLTRIGREDSRSFQQIIEYRTTHGRYWDEMSRWLRNPGVETVFRFDAREGGMMTLVELVNSRNKSPARSGKGIPPDVKASFPLFTALHRRLGEGEHKLRASRIFQEVRLLHALLKDWHQDAEIHNYLGILRASRTYGGGEKLLNVLTQTETLEGSGARFYLRQQVRSLGCLQPLNTAPDEADTDDWPVTYAQKDHHNLIRDFLLLLNVFPEKTRGPRKHVAFDFASFAGQNWSLEHLFPQNPRQQFQDLSGEDRKVFLELVASTDTAASPEEQAALVSYVLSQRPEQEEKIAEFEHRLEKATGLLHSLGNMVLLDNRTNSALSNHPFRKKRERIVQKVEQGRFIPPHTFGAFAKLLPKGADDQLEVWTQNDIRLHRDYLIKQRQQLMTYLSCNE